MQTQHDHTLEQYRRLAPWYDSIAAPLLGACYQREAVSRLHLGPGDVVVDVACGTGSNFPLIEQRIGETGHLVGVDLSPEMLRQAHARVASHGWTNVTLINASAEEARIDAAVDAFLFSFAHDVLQCPPALRNLFRHATPDARVAACGIKLAPWWNIPLNFLVLHTAQQCHTMDAGLSEPWEHLSTFVPDLEISLTAFGTVYVASGGVGADRRQIRPG